MNNIAIVGIFFDGYVDLWKDFFSLFKRNWKNCPYPIYVIDNEIELDSSITGGLAVTAIQAGKNAEYSKKVQTAIEKIDAEYYLLLLEDFFISAPVNNEKVYDIIRFINEKNIEYYTMPMPEFVDIKEKKKFCDAKNVCRISTQKEYVFSCQPSIWKKDLLKLCIGTLNYNAWIFEGIYAKTDIIRKEEFLKYSVVDYSNVLNLRHGAIQGKMVPKTVNIINKTGYKFYTNRELLPIKKIAFNGIKRMGHRFFYIFRLEKLKNILKKDSVLDKYEKDIKEVGKQIISKEKINAYIETREKKVFDL